MVHLSLIAQCKLSDIIHCAACLSGISRVREIAAKDPSATEGCAASKAVSNASEPPLGPSTHDSPAQSAQQPLTAALLPTGCHFQLPHQCGESTHIEGCTLSLASSQHSSETLQACLPAAPHNKASAAGVCPQTLEGCTRNSPLQV